MYRPNRIGPWPIGDIEIPPWVPGATLLAAIDDVAAPLIGAGVRSVTAPTVSNCEHWVLVNTTLTTTQRTGFALGCLINGVNPDPTNNILYAISGYAHYTAQVASAEQNIFPFISKLDDTPSDPDALITITDFWPLPMDSMAVDGTGRVFTASVNTQVIVGNFRGSTAAQSNLPIFVGWGFYNSDSDGFAVTARGSISVYKYLEDIQTQDPMR